MIDFFAFFLIYFLFFLSSLGYGIFFFKTANLNLNEQNIGFFGLFGIIFLTFLSYLSIFITSHNSLFNLFIHFIGLAFFLLNYKKINFKFLDLFFFIILFTALIISKNNEDFPYYHFQQALNFSQNKFQLGLANLEISFAHHSSLLYLNSLFYIPYYKYFFFNVPNLIIYTSLSIIFFNNSLDENNKLFLRFFSLFSLVFFLIKFDRLSEYGTDIMGQYTIILFSFYILKVLTHQNKIFSKKNDLVILISLLCFCVTLKTYFIVYISLFFLIFLKINFKDFYFFIRDNLYFNFYIFLFCVLFLISNLLTTGCLIFPLPYLCFENLLWAIPIDEVNNLKIWYEVWSKSLAGAGYRIDNYEELIHNFQWLKFWINNYFFTKVTDNLLAFIFLTCVMLILFRSKFSNKFIFELKNIKIFYFISFLLFIFWFTKHPTLRYGGYSIILILFSIPTAVYLSKSSKFSFNLNNRIKFFIFFCLFVFFTTNINRIYSEFNRVDKYKFTNFPFFSVPQNIKYKSKKLNDLVNVYTPINENCWDIPTPCPGGGEDLRATKKFGFILFYRDK